MNARLADRGASAPLGATVHDDGVNFSVFSKHATSIELLLFDDGSAARPAKAIPLDPDRHRTDHYWHAFVPGLRPGQVYAYRAHGPFAPERGLRFDGEKVLLDPYGLAVAVPETYYRRNASGPGDNAASSMKSVVADPVRYDWEGDVPLRRPFAETVICELHVGGFTRHPGSGVSPAKRGTYAGLIEKIPYLQDLGVTAVELLPVFQFDLQDAPEGRVNYWGYQPVSFFAPHHAYSSRKDPLGALDEFRDVQILLGAVDVRVAAGPRRAAAPLAEMDRHLASFAGRHLPVGGGPFRHGADVCRTAARLGLSRAAAPRGTRTTPHNRKGGMTWPRTRRHRMDPAT